MNNLKKYRLVLSYGSYGSFLLLLVVIYFTNDWDSTYPDVVIQEQSCDSEMDFHPKYQRNTPAIGGKDWSFKSLQRCLDKSSGFYNRSMGRRKQLVPICNNTNVSIHVATNFNQSLPLFEFPDSCLNLIIDKFSSGRVVPNIVHYIWFGIQHFELINFVSIYSAYEKQKTCLIFLFADFLPFGDLWNLLLTVIPNIIHIRISAPLYIAGRHISWVQHKADIVRLHILKEYGGIYCDTDEIILRSLNVFRNDECTMGNAHDGSLGSALILAAKNSRFINKWIESYI